MEGECPYRGLEHFDEGHARFFFGREALTEGLLDALRPSTPSGRENRFLAVIGPSGSGKSSLALAGLVPALRAGRLEGSEAWPIAVLRPGYDPPESLAVRLSGLGGEAQNPAGVRQLMRDLAEDPRSLHLSVRLALRDAPPARGVVILVDQFEEAFTLCRDEAPRRALIDNLLYAASVAGGQAIVILTMRADFYGKCAAFPALAAALSDHQMLVGPLTGDELRRAIERPAQLVGCQFEPGLVERLLNDVKDQPGALPLWQFALMELWGRRGGRRLTLAAYLWAAASSSRSPEAGGPAKRVEVDTGEVPPPEEDEAPPTNITPAVANTTQRRHGYFHRRKIGRPAAGDSEV